MFISDIKPNFKRKIRDLRFDLKYLYSCNKKISKQNKVDFNSKSIVQNRFNHIIVSSVLNYSAHLKDEDFFFFNDTATTEIYTLHIVGSVRCV